MVEWGPELHMSMWRVPLTRRGTCKTKDFDAQVRLCKENKASNVVNSSYERKRKRGAQVCCRVLSVRASRI